MQPDSTWAGVVYPVVAHWFPHVPKWLLMSILGTVISTGYAWARKIWGSKDEPVTKAEMTAAKDAPPNPVHVAIPAVVGGVVAGIPGLLVGAIGDGIRRSFWALITSVAKHAEPSK